MDQKTDDLPYRKDGLTEKTAEVFDAVTRLECIKDLFLCGGTAQSIQIGHRLSEDLDFELIGLRRERPHLNMSSVFKELQSVFPDVRTEILGEDHCHAYIHGGSVKLSFFRPQNPVPEINTGIRINNLATPSLQDLLGMKVFTINQRTLFRDYYDIYCLVENGCSLKKAVAYAGAFSRHQLHSKYMYARLLAPSLFVRTDDFDKMCPRFDVGPEEIAAKIKEAMELEMT